MELSELQPAEWNPRTITDEQLERLKLSLERLGDLGGIIYNRRSKNLVGGHQRRAALPSDAQIHIEKQYDTPTRAGTMAEGYVIAHGERFAYREVDWSETDEKIANVAANQHGGNFNWVKLSDIIGELNHLNVELDQLGFEEFELEPLLKQHDFNEKDIDVSVENNYSFKTLFRVICTNDNADKVETLLEDCGIDDLTWEKSERVYKNS